MDMITVSTVTPVYCGATTLRLLVDALDAERTLWEQHDLPLQLLEAIFIDDGSTDGSSAVLAQLAEEHHWVRPITLGRNYGQHPATIAGALHTSGDWVVTLDEDLQHQPARIAELFYEAAMSEADVVYANPTTSVHQDIWYRDLTSRLAKRLVAHLAGNPNVRLFNSFRLIRGSVARAASAVSVHDTYFDMLLTWFTNRVAAIEIPMQDQRADGQARSGYNLRRLAGHARRLMLSARVDYLRFGALLGILGMLIGTGMALYTLVLYLVAPDQIEATGWTSLFVSIMFFGGLSALLTGVLFEYFSTVLQHAQGKPTFFVVDRDADSLLRDCSGQLRQLIRTRTDPNEHSV